MHRYLSPRWLLGHFVALALVGAFLALGWWQAQRAGEGNLRSYAYAVEWPIFAGFVVFVWLREIRRVRMPAQASRQRTEQAVTSAASDRPAPASPATGSDEDDEVAAYNRMLAWLNADPGRRLTDYPG